MPTEVHVHGYLELVEGVSARQVDDACRPLLQEMEVTQLSELKSMEPEQPGFFYNAGNWALEMCCTLEVEETFFKALEAAMVALGPLCDKAAPVEVSTYHEDGRDELQLIFVGPTAAAILDAQRREMLADVGGLLARHFGQGEIDEVLGLVDQLFRRQGHALQANDFSVGLTPGGSDRRRLH